MRKATLPAVHIGAHDSMLHTLTVHARALPGPSHNETAHATVRPGELHSIGLPLHTPLLSGQLRIDIFLAAPAHVEMRHIDFLQSDGTVYHIGPHHVQTRAEVSNGFSFGRVRDSITFVVPAAPLSLLFDLATIEIGQAIGVEICLAVTPIASQRAFELPHPAQALERYREPWNRHAVECGHTLAELRVIAAEAARGSDDVATDRERINVARAWLARTSDLATP